MLLNSGLSFEALLSGNDLGTIALSNLGFPGTCEKDGVSAHNSMPVLHM